MPTVLRAKPRIWRPNRTLVESRYAWVYDNLRIAWLINEGAGDTLIDASGHAGIGTLTSAPWEIGIDGPRLRMSGTAVHEAVGPNLAIAGELTYLVKFRALAGLVSDGGSICGQYSDTARSGASTVNWSLLHNGTLLRARVVIGGVNYNIDGSAISTDDELVMVFTRSGTTGILYKNGVQDGINNSLNSGNLDTDEVLRLGCDGTGGSIVAPDIVASCYYVWDRALTATQVADISLDVFAGFRPARQLMVRAPSVGQPTMRRWAHIPHMGKAVTGGF